MNQRSADVMDIARRHRFSPEAVEILLAALASGGGGMAQFHHPELGGSGQWMRGGMLTLGDMWNDELKGRVNRVLSELTELLEKKPVKESEPDFPSLRKSAPDWWGENLGKPSASGSQNSVRYAFFPTTRRLAILDGDKVTIYDTGDHTITGVSQQQSTTRSLTFTDQRGLVRLVDLVVQDSLPRTT